MKRLIATVLFAYTLFGVMSVGVSLASSSEPAIWTIQSKEKVGVGKLNLKKLSSSKPSLLSSGELTKNDPGEKKTAKKEDDLAVFLAALTKHASLKFIFLVTWDLNRQPTYTKRTHTVDNESKISFHTVEPLPVQNLSYVAAVGLGFTLLRYESFLFGIDFPFGLSLGTFPELRAGVGLSFGYKTPQNGKNDTGRSLDFGVSIYALFGAQETVHSEAYKLSTKDKLIYFSPDAQLGKDSIPLVSLGFGLWLQI